MPKADTSETAAEREQSPLDSEPSRPAPVRGKKHSPAMRKVKEYEEVVPPEEEGSEPEAEQAPFLDDSPLDGDAEAALAMVEVERIGPGKGSGWVGNLYDYNDGNGPQPVTYARVGSYPRTSDIYDEITRIAGGGKYRFVTKGKIPVFKTLSTPPLPLPSEQEAQAQSQMSQQGGFSYPNGAMPNVRGGFDRSPAEFGFDQTQQGPSDPFDDPNFDPEVGIDPEAITSTGLNGWYRGGPYNKLIYYVNGTPSRPPRGSRPPAALLGIGAGQPAPDYYGGFNPGAYDHSARPEDNAVSELRKVVEKLAETIQKPAVDPFAAMAAQADVRLKEDRLRWEQTRADDDRKAQDRRDEEKRRYDSDQAERDRQFKLMMAKLEGDKNAADSRKSNDVEIARIQAGAAKDTAALQATAAEKMAAAQAKSSETIIQLAMQKGDMVSQFKEGVQMAMDFQGGKSDNPASQISEAIQTAAPALANAARDTMLAYKGYPVLGHQPQVQGPQGQQPQQPQIQGPAAPQGASVPDAQETFANLQLVGFLVAAIQHGFPPAVPRLADGCLAYGLSAKYDVVENMVLLATPEQVVEKFAQGAQVIPNPFANQVAMVQQVALSPQGRKWFADLKQNIMKKRAAQAAQQPAPATQPAAPVPQAPVLDQFVQPVQGQPNQPDPNHRDIPRS